MSSNATSSPVWASVRFCAIRWPVLPLSWWNRTVFLLTAEYSFTGTLTSPKEIAPLHIDRGMDPILLPRGAFHQRAHAGLRAPGVNVGRPHRPAALPTSTSPTRVNVRRGRWNSHRPNVHAGPGR